MNKDIIFGNLSIHFLSSNPDRASTEQLAVGFAVYVSFYNIHTLKTYHAYLVEKSSMQTHGVYSQNEYSLSISLEPKKLILTVKESKGHWGIYFTQGAVWDEM